MCIRDRVFSTVPALSEQRSPRNQMHHRETSGEELEFMVWEGQMMRRPGNRRRRIRLHRKWNHHSRQKRVLAKTLVDQSFYSMSSNVLMSVCWRIVALLLRVREACGLIVLAGRMHRTNSRLLARHLSNVTDRIGNLQFFPKTEDPAALRSVKGARDPVSSCGVYRLSLIHI